MYTATENTIIPTGASTAPRFPDPNAAPLASRILLCLLARGSVKPHDVDLGTRVPEFVAGMRELRALGWRVAGKPSGMGTTKDGAAVLVIGNEITRGNGKEASFRRLVESAEAQDWTERVCDAIRRKHG